MKRLPFVLIVIALSALCTPASAACTRYGRFSISSAGPWPVSITVKAGTSCEGSYQLNFPGTHLYIVSNPGHGRVSLREGGHYTYVPASGYRGADRFTLKLCGRVQGGPTESCTDLNYSVAVE